MTIVTFKLKINTRRAVIMRDIVKARDTLWDGLFLSTIYKNCCRVMNERIGNTDIFWRRIPVCTSLDKT
jgi:hypothetical protein